MSVTWNKLLADKRVAREPTSKQELDELREMIAMNLKDAQIAEVSNQGRFGFGYNAARLIATAIIRAAGYRVTSRGGHHFYTFQAHEAADRVFAAPAANFDAARSKQSDFSYDTPVPISDTDADDLVHSVKHFQQQATQWIAGKDPSLA